MLMMIFRCSILVTFQEVMLRSLRSDSAPGMILSPRTCESIAVKFLTT